jgi:hypothetical protein
MPSAGIPTVALRTDDRLCRSWRSSPRHRTAVRKNSGCKPRKPDERIARLSAWLSGECAELEETAGRPEKQRPDHRSRTCYGRWCARILEGARSGLFKPTRKSVCRHQRCTVHKTANMLNTRTAKLSSRSRSRTRSGMTCARSGRFPTIRGRLGDRHLCREIWPEIRQRGPVGWSRTGTGYSPSSTSRPLGPHSHHESLRAHSESFH